MGLIKQYLEEGQSLEKLGLTAQAIEKYSLALNHNPSCFPALERLANLYEDQQEFHKAAEYLHQMIQLRPNNIKYKMRLATAIRETGNIQEAINIYRKAVYSKLLKSDPDVVHQSWDQKRFQEPKFLIIGVMKCGTTSLYDYMTQHPQILPAMNKELHFFDKWLKNPRNKFRIKSNNFSLRPIDKKLYFSQFPALAEGSGYMTGEATPSYIRIPNTEKLIYNLFPNIKIIVILRNPVTRAISDYKMKVRTSLKKGQEFNTQLEEAIDQEMKAFEKNRNDFIKVIEENPFKILTKGLYIYHLERWMKHFPPEQLLILKTEDLSQEPTEIMKQVFQFLGLPDYQQIQFPIKNSGKYSSNIDQYLLTRLQDFYQPHNQRLEEFLGRKFNWN